MLFFSLIPLFLAWGFDSSWPNVPSRSILEHMWNIVTLWSTMRQQIRRGFWEWADGPAWMRWHFCKIYFQSFSIHSIEFHSCATWSLRALAVVVFSKHQCGAKRHSLLLTRVLPVLTCSLWLWSDSTHTHTRTVYLHMHQLYIYLLGTCKTIHIYVFIYIYLYIYVKREHDPTCQWCAVDCLCQHLAQH